MVKTREIFEDSDNDFRSTTVIIRISIILMIAVFSPNCFGQEFNDQGEGKVVIETFMAVDTITPKNPIESTTLLIKGYKVLRDVKPESKEENLRNSSNQSTDHDSSGVKVKHAMSTHYIQFSYLVDLKTQMCYFFLGKGGKGFYYQKPLEEASFENYYRVRLQRERKGEKEQQKINYDAKRTKTIAGKICYRASGYLNDPYDFKIIIWYTKEDLGVRSPLNNWVPDFPYQILSITGPMTKKAELEGYTTLKVKEAVNQRIDDDKFKLPPDAVLLDKEAWHQKYLKR